MKHILLMLTLLFSVIVSAQTKTYYNVTLTDGDKIVKEEATNTIQFNKDSVVLVAANEETFTFDLVSHFDNDITVDGYKFSFAVYQRRGSEYSIIIQVFEDKKLGVRFIINDDKSIQFY